MTESKIKMAYTPQPEERELPEVDVLEMEDKENVIVLYNDEENTFDHVIECLISICDHTFEQAQQCAIITHYKGKCEVLSGSYNHLEPRCTALLSEGLSAEIF
ncbi:ATP-dependent Clp protease adaptor ClpS [Phaeocystidibacter marisrubri]|nr:ATP-dependent Clp protease adaptor protein ClpS [Phaeocystidibacter marisrubri]